MLKSTAASIMAATPTQDGEPGHRRVSRTRRAAIFLFLLLIQFVVHLDMTSVAVAVPVGTLPCVDSSTARLTAKHRILRET